VRHVAAWLLFFAALWSLWLLLAGEWNKTQWVAAAAAATIGATVGEIARMRAGASAAAPLGTLGAVPGALAMVFVDFAIVVAALFRRADGSFLETETEVGGSQPERAWAAYLATLSANAYVLDVDAERKTALTHHLVPYAKSQDPV